MTVHGLIKYSPEDDELEAWLDEHLPDRMGGPDMFKYAESREQWDEYVEKIKAYALTCVDNPDDFRDWMDYVEPLANWDGRIAK